MNLHNKSRQGWLCLALGSSLFASNAASLSLTPPSQEVGLGDFATVTLSVSDLDPRSGASLGAWAGDIVFDSSILSLQFAQIQFGTELDLGIVGSLQSIDDSNAASGSISLQEISFEATNDLEGSQPVSFQLAVFTFLSIAPGTSGVAFANADLADASGNNLAANQVSDASITVQAASTVPDQIPSTMSFLALGSVLLLGRRWHAKA